MEMPRREEANEHIKDQLLSRMHKTKGARFAAHQRLARRHYVNGYTVAILSFYVICISVGLLIYSPVIGKSTANLLTFVSVALSVLIIVISLLVASQKYDVRSTLMHYCAREVLDLYMELKFSFVSNEDVQQYRKKYLEIINKYPDNHSALDRQLYRQAEGLLTKWQSVRVYVRYFLSVWGMNGAYMLLPLVIILGWFYAQSQPLDQTAVNPSSVQQGTLD